MDSASLEQLLQKSPALLWQGRKASTQKQGIASGFPALDRLLPSAGWPLACITEISTMQCGAGELRLLMPAIAKLTQQALYVVWIAPPFIPYAPSLSAYGIDLRYLIILDSIDNEQDQYWSMEKLLPCKQCGMVLMWPHSYHDKHIRRLQLAAEKGNSLAILYPRNRQQHSSASLRLLIQATAINQLQITILKARGVLHARTTTLSVQL
jgi:cell division inhibitor SulA/protein ImuA